MFRIGAVLLVLAALVVLPTTLSAQELLDEPVEDLVAKEKVRSAVETALENYLRARGGSRIDVAVQGIRSLLPFAEEAVPYLANELEQETDLNYDFVTYALGFLDVPAAATALREAIERAEATPGAAAMARKAWACWALGLHGEIDALKLVNEGTHQSAKFPMHAQMTVIEAIAVQTAPESVQVLLHQLATWGDSETKRGDLRFVARALRRLGHPASESALIEIIEQNDDQPALRAQAADALRSVATPESVAALTAALKDPVPGVRRAASFALKWMDQPGDVTKLLEHLETEEDLRTREALYAVTAAHARPEQLPLLLSNWNREDPEDRRLFIIALPRAKSEKTISVFSAAIEDPSDAVAMPAVGPLARLGGKEAAERLQEVLASTQRWTIVREIAKAATANDMKSLAPTITQRLVEAVQLEAVSQRGLHSACDRMAEALIELRHVAALSKLRRTQEKVKDREMVELLASTTEALELLRTNGKEVAKWVPLLTDPDKTRGGLARSRLAELGGEESATALVKAYDDVDVLARLDILRKLEEMDFPVVRALLRRMLLEPEFYLVEREGERKTAAWIVRHFGDQEMLDLLVEAVHLREGLDVETLIYAAAIGQEKMLPLLEEYRLSRLRILGLGRGYEQEVLDWITRRLKSGLPIERYDQPPNRLVIR